MKEGETQGGRPGKRNLCGEESGPLSRGGPGVGERAKMKGRGDPSSGKTEKFKKKKRGREKPVMESALPGVSFRNSGEKKRRSSSKKKKVEKGMNLESRGKTIALGGEKCPIHKSKKRVCAKGL